MLFDGDLTDFGAGAGATFAAGFEAGAVLATGFDFTGACAAFAAGAVGAAVVFVAPALEGKS